MFFCQGNFSWYKLFFYISFFLFLLQLLQQMSSHVASLLPPIIMITAFLPFFDISFFFLIQSLQQMSGHVAPHLPLIILITVFLPFFNNFHQSSKFTLHVFLLSFSVLFFLFFYVDIFSQGNVDVLNFLPSLPLCFFHFFI